jgi:hypothetical protein
VDRTLATALASHGDSSSVSAPWGFSPNCAFAKSVGVLHLEAKLSTAAADQLRAPIHEVYKPQELSCLAWAFSKLAWCRGGLVDPQLLDAVSEVSAPQLSSFKPQELANLSWAFAKAKHDGCFESLAVESFARVGALKPRQLSNIVWAFVF